MATAAEPLTGETLRRESVAYSDAEACSPENLQEQKDEILALESIFEDSLTVLSTPEKEAVSTYSLQVDVHVPTGNDGMVVEVWVPYEGAEQAVPNIPQPTVTNRPQFNRSESGRNWKTSFLLKHLTPLRLHVTLPLSYPSDTPPVYSLSCLWLDYGHLTSLCDKLDALWKHQLGMPIIFTWVTWLQDSALSYLNIDKSVILSPYLGEDGQGCMHRDPRALPECYDVQQDLITILRYDQAETWTEFVRNMQECEICFESKPGSRFYRLNVCGHHFCQECMGEFCLMHVTEGTVQQLSCANHDCKEPLPPDIVRDVLGGEAYMRWERLLLQNALDTMGDIVWCPRCNNAVVREPQKELSLAHCTTCSYSFCTECQENWHGGLPCMDLTERIADIENRSKTDAKNGFKNSVKVKEKLRLLNFEYLSKVAIKQTTKKCPKCKVPIQKNMGCNKIICSLCQTGMCWVCGKKVSDYGHFSDNRCNLFPGQPLADFPGYNRPVPEGQLLVHAAIDAGNAVIAVCPRCRQRCLRQRRNNHIRCWQCKSNFCYQCQKAISGNITEHYKVSMPCRQHSD